VPTFSQLVRMGREGIITKNEVARVGGLPGEAGCVHSRVHTDAEETELGAAQSGARPAYECD